MVERLDGEDRERDPDETEADPAAGGHVLLEDEDAEGELAIAQAKLQGVKGEATLGGAHGFERASVQVASAAVTDAAGQTRIERAGALFEAP